MPTNDWDWRAVLAILVVLLTFGLAFTQLALGLDAGARVAPWAAGVLGSVITFAYMSRSAEKMRRLSQPKSCPHCGEQIDPGR